MTATYAPPAADLAPHSDAVAIREQLIRHEAAIRSAGSLYLLGAALVLLGGGLMLLSTLAAPDAAPGLSAFAAIYAGIGVLSGWIGLGLRRLDQRVRGPAGVLSGLGLLGFPLGTLINGYILYLLFCEKGARVFSAEYQDVIAKTPHVRLGTSMLVVVLGGLLILGLGTILIAALLGA